MASEDNFNWAQEWLAGQAARQVTPEQASQSAISPLDDLNLRKNYAVQRQIAELQGFERDTPEYFAKMEDYAQKNPWAAPFVNQEKQILLKTQEELKQLPALQEQFENEYKALGVNKNFPSYAERKPYLESLVNKYKDTTLGQIPGGYFGVAQDELQNWDVNLKRYQDVKKAEEEEYQALKRKAEEERRAQEAEWEAIRRHVDRKMSQKGFGSLTPFISLGLSVFAPGIGTAIGTALGASGAAASVLGSAIFNGALSEAGGGDFVDGAIKGAVTAGVAPAIAGQVGASVASGVSDSAFSNIITNAVTSAASNAVTAAALGGDVEEAALSGAIFGAASAAGQQLGISAKYGTDAFSEQAKMLLGQEAGMSSAASIGSTVGVTAAQIASGADPETAITSALIKTAVREIPSILNATATRAVEQSPELAAQAEEEIKANNEMAQSQGFPDYATYQEFDGNNVLYEQSLTPVMAPDFEDQEVSPLDVLGQPLTPESITVEPTAPPPELITIPDEDGNQYVMDQNGNVVDIIPAEEPVEPSPLDVLGQPPTPEAVTVQPTVPAEEFVPPPEGFVGPPTEDVSDRTNEEFANYLDSLQDGSKLPPDYEVQDLGITPEDFESFNQNLLDLQEQGNLPSQWQMNEEGNYTFVADDGSTLTINPGGEIVDYTEAPVGNLPGEMPAPAPAPAPKPPSATPAPRPPSPTPVPPAPVPPAVLGAPKKELDIAALMALLGASGGTQQPIQPQQPVYAKTPEFDIVKAFAPTLYAERKKAENPYLSGLNDEV